MLAESGQAAQSSVLALIWVNMVEADRGPRKVRDQTRRSRGTGAVHSACACAPIGSTPTGAVTGSPNRKIMESGSAAASVGGRESIGETWIAR